MQDSAFPVRWYALLFALLLIAVIPGLFVTLLDNDAGHHASIALRMYLTGDYINLVSSGHPYLDKPQLLFWLSAMSFKLFGVTSFAYKFPSFLAGIFCVWSVYRAGTALYDKETGRLSALIMASSFAFLLSLTDVRMEALMTTFIAFSIWQGVLYIQTERLVHGIGLALGLALGFSVKGQLGVALPLLGLAFYLLYLRKLPFILNPKGLMVFLSFVLFISPVLYAFYQQYNLHPETTVNGKGNINGILFILFGQSAERLLGTREGHTVNKEYFFLLHSFLWAFAPWAILCYIGAIHRVISFRQKKYEWLSLGIFGPFMILLMFSAAKLPHYLNGAFPAAAILTAAWIRRSGVPKKYISWLLAITAVLMLALVLLVNTWFVPVTNIFIWFGIAGMTAVMILILTQQKIAALSKAIVAGVVTMSITFFLLNTNFYPKILRYQSGSELARMAKGKVDPGLVYFWGDLNRFSYTYYSSSIWKSYNDMPADQKGPIWLYFREADLPAIEGAGLTIGESFQADDYRISMLSFRFLNPATRPEVLEKMILGKVVSNNLLRK